MSKTMLAWQKHFGSTKPVRVEVPVPTPAEDGLLIKIHAAGVCHSDFALLQTPVKPPGYLDKYTLGHEGCGQVVSVGAKVTKFAPGDMVSILAVPGCGSATCRTCSAGVPQICPAGDHYGIGNAHGAFAPYIAVVESAAVKLPAGVSAAAGAVATDACVTSYNAVVNRAKVKKSDTVLLYGLGGLGFNALQMILNIGARVLVVDKRQEILDEAVKFGVKSEDVIPVDTVSSDWIAKRSIVVDTAIDFVGVPETFRTAIESVRHAGTVVLVGLLSGEVTIPSFVAVRKQLDILCSYGGTVEDLVACLDLISRGVITPQVETGSMADFPKILEDLHAGKVKSRIALVPEGMQ